jgi:hypothetical protein
MRLVNETELNAIKILEKKVNEYIDCHKSITISIHTELADIYQIIVPEYFKVYEDSVCIEAGLFKLKIEYITNSITYDEYEDSIILQNGYVEIDIDF